MSDAWYDQYLVRIAATVAVSLLLLVIKRVRTLVLRALTSVLRFPHVAGKWETRIEMTSGALEEHEVANLRQLGSQLWGETKRRDGTDAYRLRGHVSGEKVCLMYRATPPGLDVGAALLKLAVGGKKMEGVEVGCDLTDGSVKASKYSWTKQP